MRKVPFYICDVFGIDKNTGNQLAVFIDDQNLTSQEMQQMAAEINFSESTFIRPEPNKNGSFTTRIFTPKSEINFAGHPSLGSAYIIQHKLKNPLNSRVILDLKAGEIPIEKSQDIWWMQQIQPSFGMQFPIELIAKLLQIEEKNILTDLPIEEVSTGLPFTIVPLKNLQALKNATVNMTIYKDFIQKVTGKGILIFCEEAYTKSQEMSVRVFVPYLGIAEDPATGSANGCLAAYLLKNKSGKEIKSTVGQGYEINRPSQLHLHATLNNNRYTIKIGGAVQEVAEGYWSI